MQTTPFDRTDWSGLSDALLLVPPLVKYTAGPMLGPVMLASAARGAGFKVQVLDLNIAWLRRDGGQELWMRDTTLVGDHDRPASLGQFEARWLARCRGWLGEPPAVGSVGAPPESALWYSADDVDRAARELARSELGEWMRTLLSEVPEPRVVGLSLMFSGQVLWGLAAAQIAKQFWPRTVVIAGGSHMTALAGEIVRSDVYGRWIDRFVFGYAEATFVETLAAIRSGKMFPEACVQAGSRAQPQRAMGNMEVPLKFDACGDYRTVLPTWPVQFSRGCVYGRCAFCTYPMIEGKYSKGPDGPVRQAIEHARRTSGAISLKDSLVTHDRLQAIGTMVRGNVPWSACTKLGRWMDVVRLRSLADAGCRTLEMGIETFVEASQEMIDKKQSREDFLRAVEAAAEASVSLVVNMMTGFPGEDSPKAQEELARLRAVVSLAGAVKIEHNRFELERLAPLAKSDRIRITGSWPWSSLLAWELKPTSLVELTCGVGVRS